MGDDWLTGEGLPHGGDTRLEAGMARSGNGRPQIDLHGMSPGDALKMLVDRCNELFAQGHRGWITVIHGYGSTGAGGTTKARVRGLLDRHRDAYDAVFNDGINPGSTDVRVLQPLPTARSQTTSTEEQVLAYCETPKEEAKIAQRFRRIAIGELRPLLRRLEAAGTLVRVRHNGRNALQTARAADTAG